MEEDLLSARFDKLLKRYQEKLELLELDLPIAPETPAPAEEPAPPTEPRQTDAALPQTPAPEPPRPAEPLPQDQPAAVLPAAETSEAAPSGATPIRDEPPAAPVDDLQLPSIPAQPLPMPEDSRPTPAVAAEAPAETAAPQPDRGFGRAALWAALSLAVAAIIWSSFPSLGIKSPYRAFVLPGTAARGLAWQEGRLAAVDAESQSLLLWDIDGKRLKSAEHFSNPAPVDLVWADGAFWSTEVGSHAILQHDPDPQHGIRRSFDTPNRWPSALAADNEDLWAADATAAVVYRYLIGRSLNGTSLTPLNLYDLPGATAAGLYAANGLLWVLDSQSRRLTRYSYETGSLLAADAVDLAERLPAGAAVSGLVVGGQYLWVLSADPAVLHRFALQGLRWQRVRAQ
jgi:hypothetical protein